MALSGNFSNYGYAGYSNFGLYITWSASQNVNDNYSDVTIKAYVKTYTLYCASKPLTITAFGKTETLSANAINKSNEKWENVFLGEKTIRVPHNSDGTMSGTISAKWDCAVTFGGTYVASMTATSSSISLDTIPRASSISSISNDGLTINGTNALTVNISRASTSFTHTVKFQFGSSFSHTATGQGTSCAYAIPLTWIGGFGSGGSGTLKGTVTVTTFNGSTQIGNAVSKEFSLKCPSASTISSATESITCNSSNKIEVNISRSISSFTHTVKWVFGSHDYTIYDVGTSTSHAPPTSWLSAIPNNNSGTGSVTVTTYYGTQQIGSAVSKNFTLLVPSYTPSFSSVTVALVQDSSISDWTVYVQNKSKAKFTFNGVAGSYSSTIKSYKVTIDGKDYTGNNVTTNVLNGTGTLNYTATVTDSRNKTATKTGSISVQAIVTPKFTSLTAYRYNGTAKDDEGTKLYFKMQFTFQSYSNFNSVTTSLKYKLSTGTTYTSVGSFTNNTAFIPSLTLDMAKSYDFVATVTDELGGKIEKYFTIDTSTAIIDISDSGKGLGLLKMSTMDDCVEVGGHLYTDESVNGLYVTKIQTKDKTTVSFECGTHVHGIIMGDENNSACAYIFARVSATKLSGVGSISVSGGVVTLTTVNWSYITILSNGKLNLTVS